MQQQFAGRTALVTGGGSGIGRATARALAAEGALVTVAGRTQDTLRETVRLIEERGGAARYVVADMSDELAVAAAVEAAVGDTGRLDFAVNNAGYDGEYQLAQDYSTDMLDTMIAVNVRGVFLSMKYELRHMAAQGFGSVVNMSSGAGLVGTLKRLPLRGAMDGLGGNGAPWYDEWIDHPDVNDPYWEAFRATDAFQRTTVPTLLIGGWHDYFLNQTLQQYDTLRSRNVDVAMTIGPWTHLNVDNKMSMPQALAWLDAHTAGRTPVRRKTPVRVFLGGAEEWQDHQAWPPEPDGQATWYLRGR